jgi:hypothetical protein
LGERHELYEFELVMSITSQKPEYLANVSCMEVAIHMRNEIHEQKHIKGNKR